MEHFFKRRRNTFTFKPRFGIIVPSVDFTTFNRQRPEQVATTRTFLCSVHHFILCVCVLLSKGWDYDRGQLVYLREIGEGQFGKVLLMKAKVDQLRKMTNWSTYNSAFYTLVIMKLKLPKLLANLIIIVLYTFFCTVQSY